MSENSYTVKSFGDSDAEILVRVTLEKYINSEHYIVADHVKLPKLFTNIENTESFAWFYQTYIPLIKKHNSNQHEISFTLKQIIEFMEYDFVIYETKFALPILFIEINGTHHLKEDSKIRDNFKHLLAKECEIPMISLELFTSEDNDLIVQSLKRELINKTLPGECPVYCPNSKCKRRLRPWWDNFGTSKALSLKYYYCPTCKKMQIKKEDFIPPFIFHNNTESAKEYSKPVNSSLQQFPIPENFLRSPVITVRNNIYLLEGKYYCGNSNCKGTPFVGLGIDDATSTNENTKIAICEIDVTNTTGEDTINQMFKKVIPQELWIHIEKYLQNEYFAGFYKKCYLKCKHCNNTIYAPTNIYNNISGFTDMFLPVPKKKGILNIVKPKTPKAYSELRVMVYPLKEELRLSWYKTNIIIDCSPDQIVSLDSV